MRNLAKRNTSVTQLCKIQGGYELDQFNFIIRYELPTVSNYKFLISWQFFNIESKSYFESFYKIL